MRIALMVIRLIFWVPYLFGGICWHGVRKDYNFEEAYKHIQLVARKACKAGRVTLEAEGNIFRRKTDLFSSQTIRDYLMY